MFSQTLQSNSVTQILKNTFNKSEHLTNRQIIDRLFERGSTDVKSFYLFPFRVLYLHASETPPPAPQILFSISRRQFKKAVDRNWIRRRCREAYRLNKQLLLDVPVASRPAYIAFLYLAKEKKEYDVIKKAMITLLSRIAKAPENSNR